MSATKPLTLSIVIPAYNEERHLQACLDSIAAQTEPPDEVLVVDNNSKDKTTTIAKKYAFVHVIHEQQQGVVFARNRGFNAATSALIGRIDADSILPHDWVKRVKDFYRRPGRAEQTLTGGCYFYNIRLPHFSGWWQGQIAFRVNRLLLGHYILFGSNMVIPRSVWRAVRSSTCHDTDIHEDLDLAIHTYRAGYQIIYKESLRVGIKMRRVRSERDQLWENMIWWPRTLQRHGLWTWIFGWLGAVLLYVSSPLLVTWEWLARLFGKPPIPE